MMSGVQHQGRLVDHGVRLRGLELGILVGFVSRPSCVCRAIATEMSNPETTCGGFQLWRRLLIRAGLVCDGLRRAVST